MIDDEEIARHRRDVIERLGLLNSVGNPGLTGLARLATFVTGARCGAVHILDEQYQHRVAAVNAPLEAHARADSMCRLVVESGTGIVCDDATGDARFAYSSYVQGDEPVRFYASLPLRASDGTIVGTVCAFDTVARTLHREQEQAMEDLAQPALAQVELMRVAADLGAAASRDPLTGALNRRALADRLDLAMARRQRHGTGVLVAVLDVDDFKGVNDREGHPAGDGVLAAIAGTLRGATRAEDTVARLGGDEFVVVIETTDDGERAEALVARLRDALTGTLHSPDGRPITLSLGFAVAQGAEGAGPLLARADVDLYRRKAAGRS